MARRVFQMRDKHLSTTNLYPKQIEQSLPEGVVPVEPEPETYTPTGEEPDAEYITINNVTYKIGGTNVVANPTLVGTEADLEGLQVGDTKYKVPSGSFTQEQADWTEADNTKPSYIKNKPNLSAVATSGDYADLTNKPTIPSVVANPTLAGNESDLKSIEINGVKYSNSKEYSKSLFISIPTPSQSLNFQVNAPVSFNNLIEVTGFVNRVNQTGAKNYFKILLKPYIQGTDTRINGTHIVGYTDFQICVQTHCYKSSANQNVYLGLTMFLYDTSGVESISNFEAQVLEVNEIFNN